ncbi:hypothetical protein [Chachezhania sediminis]|uniref:hypothetical protein n=1 Tax=Chachezhania sediminis TaxID=2599291 RepID=UPI001E316E81|nr:hypothetical protein [Chachezhania sediminis]
MRLRPDQSIPERVAILEAALEKLLDRDDIMSVEPTEKPGEMAVWVRTRWCGSCESGDRTGYDLGQLARELEVLLS